MHVIATAGHVDHGKSTLVRGLTGTDPDRLEEEHRRGLSIELGYCWTSIDPVGDVAFVDVPGHERFISTMLSGIGPVPAVLFVVAADDPWMPQAAEHLAALDALGVSRGVVAVTRSDLADPAPATERAVVELARTSLRGAPVVAVSGRTGQGLDELRQHLVAMVQALPSPDPGADVRLWVDRRFTIKGAGTVVTGTLPAGRVSVGDTLRFGERPLRVRGVQSLGAPVSAAEGAARVALNVTGDDLTGLDRGSVLVSPDAWELTDIVDVRVSASRVPSDLGQHGAMPPERPLLHIGAASVGTHCRPLAGDVARLTLDEPLPLRVGDRALVRDPGSRQVWGITVLDPAPPSLRRRGAAAERAKALVDVDGGPDLDSEVDRRGVVGLGWLGRIGVRATEDSARDAGHVVADGWVVSQAHAASARATLERLVAEHDRDSPLSQGIPLVVLAERLGLPSPALVECLVRPPLQVSDGRVSARRSAVLAPTVERAVEAVLGELRDNPFVAPTADRLRDLGLDDKSAAAAAKAGLLLRVAPGIVLAPGADDRAVELLRGLPQPFTTSEARVRLGTSRRVVLPLLAHLDRRGATRRLPDDRRQLMA